ncbi:MAG TPA: helix-turn-helix domain-containing protein [Candidatus Mediterraneibacter merdavium]|nr:helix-turn-helix domain-containing protein [Candidatus Mediterraneibacter merdavium]
MRSILGENIKRLRRQRGIKQAVLASALNIGRQTISAYERGITLPDIFVLIQIADYFEVTLDELTGREALVIDGEEDL